MDGLVTIIVPVYNMHAYIGRCAETLTRQTYQNLQIILVDDGSTDGSGEICDAIAGKDERVEVFRRTNAGVSAARNTGLERVRGQWIAFVDADDFVSPYYIEDLLGAANEDCEMAICRFVWVPDGGEKDVSFRRGENIRRITGREACIRRFGKELPLYNRCWGKIYKAQLWEDLRYPEDMTIGEDLFVSHTLLYRAGHIAITDGILYAYAQTPGSIMSGNYSPKRLDALDAWQEAVRLFSEAGDKELEKIARRVYCSRVFDAQYICKKQDPEDRENLIMLRQRAVAAYRDAKPIKGYIDGPSYMTLAYKLKLFLGRWRLPLYARLFIGKRTSL